jgi:hypothetical protein
LKNSCQFEKIVKNFSPRIRTITTLTLPVSNETLGGGLQAKSTLLQVQTIRVVNVQTVNYRTEMQEKVDYLIEV